MSVYSLQGVVLGAEMATPLPQVKVTRRDGQGGDLGEAFSDAEGRWRLDCRPGDTVVFEREGYARKTFEGCGIPRTVRLLENALIGYQDRLWFRAGEPVALYVHSPGSYRARLFRHGLHKTCVLDLGAHQACLQTVPDGFFVEGGLNWRKSLEYTVPADAAPGLYSLLLEAQGEQPFAVPMVLSTPESARGGDSRILVLASTNTWQSYNIWGGRSRYRNFEEGLSREFSEVGRKKSRARKIASAWAPPWLHAALRRAAGNPGKSKSKPAWMFKRLSIRRPFTNCALEGGDVYEPFANHLASGEWRLLAWLEREKIGYDIVSGAELDGSPDLLADYRAIIFSTHSEYWSSRMYDAVKKYHDDRGLWLINLSGNTLYRQIEFFEDGSTRCVSIRFSESCADESRLLGVRFSMSDYGTCAPYRALRPDHWVFKNAPLDRDSLVFGEKSLNRMVPVDSPRYDPGRPGHREGLRGEGASGWETDKLTATAPEDMVVVAKGMNADGGADMVVREPLGTRGGVFSGSSVTFSGCLLTDPVASTIVRNVVDRAVE